MFKVYLQRTDFIDKLDMYVVEHRTDNKITYMTTGGENQPPFIHTVDIGTEIKPFLSFSGLAAKEFFQALAEALSKEGIETEKDARIKGTLDATRYHLEDLRTMLKLSAPKGEPSNV